MKFGKNLLSKSMVELEVLFKKGTKNIFFFKSFHDGIKLFNNSYNLCKIYFFIGLMNIDNVIGFSVYHI